MQFLLGFIIGMSVGATIGVFTISLVIASRQDSYPSAADSSETEKQKAEQ